LLRPAPLALRLLGRLVGGLAVLLGLFGLLAGLPVLVPRLLFSGLFALVGGPGVHDVVLAGEHVAALGALDLGIRLRGGGRGEVGFACGAAEFASHGGMNSRSDTDVMMGPTCRSYRVGAPRGKG